MKSNQKGFNLPSLVAISAGGAVSGVVTTIMLATQATGPSAWMSYCIAVLIGGILRVLPVIFFAGMFRYKGGNYTLVTASLGELAGGIYALWWLPMFVSRGVAASAMGQYLSSLFPQLDANLAGVLITTLIFIINLFGLNFMVKVQRKLTALSALALIVFAIAGMGHLSPNALAVSSADYYPGGALGMITAVTLVIQATSAPSLVCGFSWQAENPKRNIPLAILISNGIILLLYGTVAFVCGNIEGAAELFGKPLTAYASRIFPGIMFAIFVFAGPFMTLFVSMNSGMASVSAPVIGAIHNGWLPKSLGNTNKHGVPWKIYTLMWLICVVPLLLNVSLKTFTAYTVITQRISGMLLLISAFTFPNRFQDRWEAAPFHMPKPVYYTLLCVIGVIELATLFLSVRNVSSAVFYGNLILVAVLAVYAFFRYRNGKTTVHMELE